MEKLLKLEIHAPLNCIHATSDNSEEILGKNWSAVYDRTHRAISIQHHLYQ